MEAEALMTKLVELQRRTDSPEATRLVLAMREDVLNLERSLIAALAENTRLRERLRGRLKSSAYRAQRPKKWTICSPLTEKRGEG